MSLRAKLLLAQAPLGIALVVLGIVGVWSVSSLGVQSQRILQDNYRSVLAAQRMKESIERLDSGAMFAAIGERDRAIAQIEEYRPPFEAELVVQENNITEPGEQEATAALRKNWMEYQERLRDYLALDDPATLKQHYFDALQPAFVAVKNSADKILSINQDTMVHKSEAAKRLAQQINTTLITSAVAALIVGLALSVSLTNRLMRPLSVLTQAVDRLGQGDFRARAIATGKDEIGQLATQFNQMAEHLEEYRNSSLGELLLAQQASQAAIDSIPDPVLVFNADKEILNINDAAEILLDRGPDASETGVLATLEPGLRARLEAALAHVLGGKGPYLPQGYEEAFPMAVSGGERYFLLRASPVYDEQGRITGSTAILQDVTKLRRFDELKNDLVATVAHEFRTPLTSLRMAIHLCLETVAGPITAKQADLLYASREDCERLQSIVNELLDLARIQSGRIEMRTQRVSVPSLVDAATSAHRALAEGKRVHLSAEISPLPGDAWADPEQIQIVLANLITNAIRHTPAEGKVRVRTKVLDDEIRFEVSDTGEGIPPEYQAAIFNKFFRVPGRAAGAAGLGLPLAKEIVEANGGQIGVESRSGQGSTFWFTLPMASSATAV